MRYLISAALVLVGAAPAWAGYDKLICESADHNTFISGSIWGGDGTLFTLVRETAHKIAVRSVVSGDIRLVLDSAPEAVAQAIAQAKDVPPRIVVSSASPPKMLWQHDQEADKNPSCRDLEDHEFTQKLKIVEWFENGGKVERSERSASFSCHYVSVTAADCGGKSSD